MKTVPYYIVDVFAENRFEGNQLAVFLNAATLTDSEMLNIAQEMNYSEVSFVNSNKETNNGFAVRIFTPTGEVPFAGHPSLGTAYVIVTHMLSEKVASINLNLKAGKVLITLDYRNQLADMLWMKQLNPTFSNFIEPRIILEILGLDEEDIDIKFPIQEVSTGLATIIVPLKNLKSIEKCTINKEKYFQLVDKIDAKLIHVFCPETHSKQNQLNVRNFGDYYGISEEPATGSANGCLAAYLVNYRYFNDVKIDIRVEQGREINRLGHLYLRAEKLQQKINVWIGGKVVSIAHGEFYV